MGDVKMETETHKILKIFICVNGYSRTMDRPTKSVSGNPQRNWKGKLYWGERRGKKWKGYDWLHLRSSSICSFWLESPLLCKLVCGFWLLNLRSICFYNRGICGLERRLSRGKGDPAQTWQPELDPWNPRRKKRPESYKLPSDLQTLAESSTCFG